MSNITDWCHSLEEAERSYRSLASCDIPVGECPWDESEHVEARIVVALLDEKIKRLDV